MQNDPYIFADLLAKYLRNELTASEHEQFEAILQQNELYKQTLHSFKDTSRAQQEIDFMSNIDKEDAWEKIMKRKKTKNHYKFFVTASIAATLIFLFSVFWQRSVEENQIPFEEQMVKVEYDASPARSQAHLIMSNGRVIDLDGSSKKLTEEGGTYINVEKEEMEYLSAIKLPSQGLVYNTLKVPSSGTYRLKLADGTTVWVNSLTELRFPVQFGSRERRVYLSGEAYFEVSKDQSRPFRVVMDGTEVEVLGTQFNVKSYGKATATTLLEGAVKVLHNKKSIVLVPGQEAKSIDNEIQVNAANVIKATAWKNNIFYFEGEGIREIMDEISRWYNVEISYRGEIPNDGYKGIVKRDVNLSEVLEMLSFISGLKFEISERSVIVRA